MSMTPYLYYRTTARYLGSGKKADVRNTKRKRLSA